MDATTSTEHQAVLDSVAAPMLPQPQKKMKLSKLITMFYIIETLGAVQFSSMVQWFIIMIVGSTQKLIYQYQEKSLWTGKQFHYFCSHSNRKSIC